MKIELDLPQVPEGYKFVGWNMPQAGQFYLSDDKFFTECKKDVLPYYYLTFERIEPEIDWELEQAKKLNGTWVTVSDIHGIFEVVEVERIIASLVLTTKDGRSHLIEYCTPFPLPVWRCCESDKPKVGQYYPVRKNKSLTYDLIRFDGSGFWDTDLLISKYEWLDEGDV
jgi:hypothetical protein